MGKITKSSDNFCLGCVVLVIFAFILFFLFVNIDNFITMLLVFGGIIFLFWLFRAKKKEVVDNPDIHKKDRDRIIEEK